MDLIKLIKEKIGRFVNTPHFSGLESVVLHIEIAEKHRERGKQENNDFLFTDAIYRTNHAFEGILKEAYAILTQQDPVTKNPFQIEKYLETNNILRERVSSLLKNYRVEWRNPSTHDYKLFFTEQESFLAIVSICAFIIILLDQLIEKSAFDREKEEVSKTGENPTAIIQDYQTLDLWKQIIELLKDYSSKFSRPLTSSLGWNQAEILGGLAAFIQFADDRIDISREVSIESGNLKALADMVLEKENDKIILEIKRAKKYTTDMEPAMDQVFSYLSAAKINVGILYFFPDEPAFSMVESVVERKVGGIVQKVIRLFPKET